MGLDRSSFLFIFPFYFIVGMLFLYLVFLAHGGLELMLSHIEAHVPNRLIMQGTSGDIFFRKTSVTCSHAHAEGWYESIFTYKVNRVARSVFIYYQNPFSVVVVVNGDYGWFLIEVAAVLGTWSTCICPSCEPNPLVKGALINCIWVSLVCYTAI